MYEVYSFMFRKNRLAVEVLQWLEQAEFECPKCKFWKPDSISMEWRKQEMSFTIFSNCVVLEAKWRKFELWQELQPEVDEQAADLFTEIVLLDQRISKDQRDEQRNDQRDKRDERNRLNLF